MMITPRLDLILKHISGKSVADVGTDHAYIPIRLAQRGIKVIATDIRQGPLDMAAAHVKKAGCDVELRLGPGLDPISAGETEDIVIAGMGGEMIIKILTADEEKAKSATLILQPMNSQYELRQFLYRNGYDILCEDLAIEGFKVYNLIVAKASSSQKNSCELSNTPADDIDFHLPKELYNHPLFLHLLNKKKREYSRIFSGLSASAGSDQDQLNYAKQTLDSIQSIEKEISQN